MKTIFFISWCVVNTLWNPCPNELHELNVQRHGDMYLCFHGTHQDTICGEVRMFADSMEYVKFYKKIKNDKSVISTCTYRHREAFFSNPE